ncbi:MAG: T9SS type A sorting domain-containing protein [Flavobacteriales bacterium]|nr:T9SS type A sorting domain-containing protein [Flavobacteriales bacterium]
MAMLADGGALLVGAYVVNGTSSNAYAVRVDANGDTLWTRTYGGPNTAETAFCARGTPDGGFILSGTQLLPGSDIEMLLLKLDSAGNLEWQEHYGSPWVDGVAFVEVLPQGGYIMAGAERAAAAYSAIRPVLYRLDDGGNELWSVHYLDSTLRDFFTVPVLMADGGYTIAGTGQGDGQILGMLMRTDSLGNTLWKRSYSTNAVRDHYIYDLRRTLDGGFIMAGTAWDSLLVSQDAWLIKTDSFGCLVPGCQIFDGLQEQLTDLSASLAIYPNPAQDHVNVQLELPATLRVQGPLRLAVTSLDGRLVHERQVPLAFGPLPFANCLLPTASWPSGTYFVHLLEGTRWLAGGKVVVSR